MLETRFRSISNRTRREDTTRTGKQVVFATGYAHGFSPVFFPAYTLSPGTTYCFEDSKIRGQPEYAARIWWNGAWETLLTYQPSFTTAPLVCENWEIYDGEGLPSWSVPSTEYGYSQAVQTCTGASGWHNWPTSYVTDAMNSNYIEGYSTTWSNKYYQWSAGGH